MRRVIGYTGNLEAEQVTEIVEAYNKATGDNARATSCPSCIEQMKAALSEFLAIDEEAEIQEATKKQALLFPRKKVESKGGKQEE